MSFWRPTLRLSDLELLVGAQGRIVAHKPVVPRTLVIGRLNFLFAPLLGRVYRLRCLVAQ